MNSVWNTLSAWIEGISREFWKQEKTKYPADFLLKGILGITGFLILARTSNLFFEADDFRFLWWAFTHFTKPWEAFTDPPLFANYYRPVISLVWWLHSWLFGLNAYYHQLALGAWWLLILGLVFHWNKKLDCALSGFIAGVILLSSLPMQDIIVWKSWLTTCCSLVFHLSTLLFIQKYLNHPGKRRLLGFFIFFILASLAKESSRFLLLFTCNTLIFFHPSDAGKRKAVLSAIIGLLWSGFFLSSYTLVTSASNITNSLLQVHQSISALCFFASTLYANPCIELIAYMAITTCLCKEASRFYWKPVLCHLTAVAAYFFARQYNINPSQAIAFSLLVYTQGLWVSTHKQFIAMPLAWLLFSFWPLAMIPLLSIAYGVDSAVALAMILGFVICQSIRQTIVPGRYINARIPVCFLLFFSLGFSLLQSLRNIDNRVNYAENAYHAPTKTLLTKIGSDLTGIRSWGNIYIYDEERLGLETYLSLYFSQKQFAFHVIPTRPPSNQDYRLETYTGGNYHIYPDEDPLNIWLPSGVNPLPDASILNDPYCVPEQWEIKRIGSCDNPEGWESKTKFRQAIYPIGQDGGYVNFDLTWSKEPIVLTYTSKQDCTWLENNDSSVLSFWLQSQRWSMIDYFTIILYKNDKQYTWDNVHPVVVNTWNQWKRVCLQDKDAQISVSGENTKIFRLQILIHIKDFNDDVGTYLSVDEIRLAKRKP